MRCLKARNRLLCGLAALLVCLTIFFPVMGTNGGEKKTAVRIMLSNLALQDSLKIGVFGNYSIGNHISFQRGLELLVRLSPQGLVLFYEGMSYYPGNHIELKRHQAEAGLENGLRLQGGLNLYTGDLRISIREQKLEAILAAPVEEYLMGVVPYEMSDDFPLEALKAQAIAARTYTLRNLKPGERYDMSDTTSDQVYYGLNPEKHNAIRAVRETDGIACFYDNQLAQCYYTASNGGFTESALNAWGRENIPYLGIVEDRYDLENPQSQARQARLPVQITDQTAQIPPALMNLLLPALQSRMQALGYSPDITHIRIEGIENIVPHTTRFGGENGVMKFLRFDLKVSGRSLETEDQEVYFPMAGSTSAPAAQGATALSEIRLLPQTISLDCALFPDVEQALNLSINRNPNELVRVEKSDNEILVSFTRYGHGVGLSQRGAEWMAATYGWDFEKILRFYYPGTQLKRVDTSYGLPPPIGNAYLTTPGPIPTATPRPTLMPVDRSKAAGKPIARVTKIPVNSSLNLRAQANLNSEVLMRLYYNQELIVLSQSEDGWLWVETDVIQGYVREEFVSFDQD